MTIKRHVFVPAVGIALLCGALITGCGGGTTPATTTTGINAGTANGTVPANSAAITLSIALPKKAPATSGRAPAYVSGRTYQVAVTANPSASTSYISCSAGTCSGTIYAPLSTTSLTVKLQSSSGGTLSQATQPVTLTAGQNNTVTFTFDGVVASFVISATLPSTGLVMTALPTSIPFTITPNDVAGLPITGPGNLIDGSGNVIVGAGGTPQTVTLTSSNPAIVPGALTWNGPASYTFTGTALYNGADPGLSPDQIVLTASTTAGTATGSVVFPLNPKAMFIGIDPLHSPSGYTISVPTAVPTAGTVTTNTLVEIPLAMSTPSAPPTGPVPPPPSNVNLWVYTNFNPGIGSLSIQSNWCDSSPYYYDANSGIPNAFSSPPPSSSGGYTFSFGAYSSAAGSCQFTLFDSTNNVSASATVYFNSPQLIIQGKARR